MLSPTQRIVYGKLVRDRMPEIIESDGKVPIVRVLDEIDVVPALITKLAEEAEELRTAGSGDRLGELADLREVLSALTTALGFSHEQVYKAAEQKRDARGGFDRRLWLEEVQVQGASGLNC
jgi:predicted house-cleaning noncanonical NTP pyrophosphatase (MazG superfamily)